MITVGTRILRTTIVLGVALTAVASVAFGAGGGSKAYKVEKVIDDLRVPANIPGGPEKGFATSVFGQMIFVSKKVGWVNAGGFLGKTTDGGRSWMPVESRSAGYTFFLNERMGWTAGCVRGNPFGKTVDGGETWTIWKPSRVPCLSNLFFVDSEFGWAFGRYPPSIYRTTDGGKTWARQRSGTRSTLTNLYFINRSEGWVVTAAGEILHTRDGGGHWEIQQGKASVHLFSVKFWDDKIGYAVGTGAHGGVILSTTDGGKSWRKPETRLPVVQEGLLPRGILIQSTDECWVVGWPGLVLRTTDTGKHWENIAIGESPAPAFRSLALVEQDGRDAILILSDAGGLYRIWLDP